MSPAVPFSHNPLFPREGGGPEPLVRRCLALDPRFRGGTVMMRVPYPFPFALSEVEGRATGAALGARASTSLSTNGFGGGGVR